MPLNKNKQ